MMTKTRADVEQVISLGKPQRVIDLFITEYLTAKAAAELPEGDPPAEPVLDLIEWRELQKLAIRQRFESALKQGRCDLSLGWPIDCRRSAIHDDLGNMERLLGKMIREGLAGTVIKGADDDFHPTTLEQLRDVVIPEMVDYGLGLYQARWEAEATL